MEWGEEKYKPGLQHISSSASTSLPLPSFFHFSCFLFSFLSLFCSFLLPFLLFFLPFFLPSFCCSSYPCNIDIRVSQNNCSIIVQQKRSSSYVSLYTKHLYCTHMYTQATHCTQYKLNRCKSLDDVHSCGSLEVRELFKFVSDHTWNTAVHFEMNNVWGKKTINDDYDITLYFVHIRS